MKNLFHFHMPVSTRFVFKGLEGTRVYEKETKDYQETLENQNNKKLDKQAEAQLRKVRGELEMYKLNEEEYKFHSYGLAVPLKYHPKKNIFQVKYLDVALTLDSVIAVANLINFLRRQYPGGKFEIGSGIMDWLEGDTGDLEVNDPWYAPIVKQGDDALHKDTFQKFFPLRGDQLKFVEYMNQFAD